ncbi:hypothetical protein GCM10019996_12240 [Lentilactobacillus parakefiri]
MKHSVPLAPDIVLFYNVMSSRGDNYEQTFNSFIATGSLLAAGAISIPVPTTADAKALSL